MNYNVVVDKIRKVIHSCLSVEQLEVARRYTNLLIRRLKKKTINGCLSMWDAHFYSLELIKWRNTEIVKRDIQLREVKDTVVKGGIVQRQRQMV